MFERFSCQNSVSNEDKTIPTSSDLYVPVFNEVSQMFEKKMMKKRGLKRDDFVIAL